MKGWTEGLAEAINYMEKNLTGELELSDIAAKTGLSAFYFQKIFTALCGIPVGEYIRNRRLTLAAEELVCDKAKVIDLTMKYGYDSPDSFSRAFTRFHGVSPSAARENGVRLHSMAPLKIKLSLEGGEMLEYRIEEKAAMKVVGCQREMNSETSYQEIPKFWQEHVHGALSEVIIGMYGICLDSDGKHFTYMIADDYEADAPIPEGCVVQELPAGTWAVFPCRGALPKALQEVNTKIWTEWVPACKKYVLAGNYNVEMYTEPKENPNDDYNEIWVPVELA